MLCIRCDKELIGRQTKYCSRKCENLINRNSYLAQKERAFSRKKGIVLSLGGKCSICGYNKNLSAFELHHKNPKEKDFNLDSRKLSNTSMDKINKEVSKCQLLCANCHREYHNPNLDNWAVLDSNQESPDYESGALPLS